MPRKKTGEGAKPVDTKNETARDRFLRLGAPRTEVALKRISLLGNLATSAYEFEAAEANQIIDALTEAVAEVKARFDKKLKGSKKEGFKFVSRNKAAA